MEAMIQTSTGVIMPHQELFYSEMLGRKLTREERIEKAAFYVRESVKGHKFLDRTKWQKRFYLWHSWRVWRVFVFLVIVGHMALARWEPPSYRNKLKENGRVYAGLEVVFCAVYWVDIALKFPSMGGWKYFKSWDTGSYVGATFLVTVDALITLGAETNYRFSRPFRACLLVASSAKLRDIVGTMLRAIPKLLEISIAFLALILTYAIMGMNLYHSYYASDGLGDFNSFSSSVLSMFVLATSENYPDIMRAAYDRDNANVVFFVTYILLSVFLLMNVLVAIILEGYKAIRQDKVSKDFVEENKALNTSFALLDVNNDGMISFDEWRDFLDAVSHKGYSQEQALMLFHHMDTHHSGQGINRIDWDGLVDTLLLRFKRRREVDSVVPSCIVNAFADLSQTVRSYRRKFKSRYVKFVVMAVVIANIIVLGLVGSVGDSDTISVLYSFNLAFLVFFGLEHAMSMMIQGLAKFWDSGWNRFDLFIFATQVTATTILLVSNPKKAFGFPNKEDSVRLLQGLFALRALRLVSLFGRIRRVVTCMLEVLPTMASVFFLIITVFYVYAIIGLELFAGSGSGQFPNFVETQLTLFQLLTGSNWHELMYEEMRLSSPYAAWYFVSFVILVNVVFLNVLVAIVIDVFVQQVALIEASDSGSFLNVMTSSDGRWRVWKSNLRWEREVFRQVRQSTASDSRHIELRDDADLHELGILDEDRLHSVSNKLAAPTGGKSKLVKSASLLAVETARKNGDVGLEYSEDVETSSYDNGSDSSVFLGSRPLISKSKNTTQTEVIDLELIAQQAGVELEEPLDSDDEPSSRSDVELGAVETSSSTDSSSYDSSGSSGDSGDSDDSSSENAPPPAEAVEPVEAAPAEVEADDPVAQEMDEKTEIEEKKPADWLAPRSSDAAVAVAAPSSTPAAPPSEPAAAPAPLVHEVHDDDYSSGEEVSLLDKH